MEELNNKIINYMNHFRNYNFREIINILHPSDEVYKQTIEQLLMTGEEELFHYKMSVFNPLFTFINNTKNSLPKNDYLANQITCIAGVLLVIFIQKQCAAGKIEFSNECNYNDTGSQEENICENMEDIITEINKSVVINSGFNKNKYIKNILHYVQELDNIKKSFSVLLTQVSDSDKEAYMNNFSRIETKIENRIKKNYRNFKGISNDAGNNESNMLQSVFLKRLVPILNVQLEILVKIYVTCCFALDQKNGMNKTIFPLIVEQKNLISLLKKEETVYKSLFLKCIEDPEIRKERMKWLKQTLYKEVLFYFRKNIDYK
ncbi:MAG: hypothetical protein JXB88_08180 [Spirochaetales bacterium]|nr:hypothetical protein [Spirochaetales bacterium]